MKFVHGTQKKSNLRFHKKNTKTAPVKHLLKPHKPKNSFSVPHS